LFSLLILVGCSSGAALERANVESAGPPASRLVSLRIAGDSTAAAFPPADPRVGWGAVFQDFVDATVSVDDRALSGRSSKSYIDEGAWASLLRSLRPGDHVFIGFGHNDEKSEDPARYTDPETTFRDNLTRFVREARDAGAEPLLLTPISRRKFDGVSLVDTHGAYPEAVAAVAGATSTTLIDLTARTREWLEALGPSSSAAFFAPDDRTHTSRSGARAIAGFVAAELRALQHPLASRLRAHGP
jgi:lysophospholipase L1-like esterase